ncbi:MAG TPA: hypothetical protein VF787_08170 [Thermoanaerobaculia bacterium]
MAAIYDVVGKNLVAIGQAPKGRNRFEPDYVGDFMRVPTFDQLEHFVLRLILLIFLILVGLRMIRDEAATLLGVAHHPPVVVQTSAPASTKARSP